MSIDRPYVLSIAGFDPSGGAGVLADIKCFEEHETYGLGVNTANTWQHESEFKDLQWSSEDDIRNQVEILAKRYSLAYCKIGLFPNFEFLQEVLTYLKNKNLDVKIIWDPILSASAGFQFHSHWEKEKLITLFRKLYLLTPNIPEIKKLLGTSDPSQIQDFLRREELQLNILLKGGHSEGDEVTDVLISAEEITPIPGDRAQGYDKHGTGCVLSAAILSNLAKGESLLDSCRKAKQYISEFICSSESLLGFHKNRNNGN